jgi:hypothetical protein
MGSSGNATQLKEVGGDEEDRTPGLGIANAALSQLSYIPTRIDSLESRLESFKRTLSNYQLSIINFLLNSCRQQRSFRVGRECVSFFDLSDDAVKRNVFTRYDDDHVAGAVFFLVYRKLDDRRVSVVLCDGFVFKSVRVKTDRLTKCYFHCLYKNPRGFIQMITVAFIANSVCDQEKTPSDHQ